MPINLPNIETGMDAFLKQLQQEKENRFKEAAAQESYGNAAKSNMIANLLKTALGGQGQGNQPYQLTDEDKRRMGALRPGESYTIPERPSSNTSQESAKRMLQAFGILKETPDEQEARENRKAERQAAIEARQTEKKSQLEIDAAAHKKLNEANLKKKEELLAGGELINKYANHAVALSNLLEKNPKLTGNLPAFVNELNLSGRDTGAFTFHATPLVGGLARDLSSKGGAVVARMAAAAKPQLKKSGDYNKGALDELHKATYRDWKEAKKEYEKLTGEQYPVKLPKFYDKVKVVSPKGHIVIKSPDEAEKLIAKYPGSKIMGNAYDEE